MLNHSFPTRSFFFLKQRLGHAHLFHSLGQDQDQPPAASAGIQICNLLITSQALYQQAILVPLFCNELLTVGLPIF